MAGRPPRPVAQHPYVTPLPAPTALAVAALAAGWGATRAQVTDALISAAHDYHPAHLEHLHQHLLTLTTCRPHDLQDLTGNRPVTGTPTTIRLDRPLAEHINHTCRTAGVRYGTYLRHVLNATTHALHANPGERYDVVQPQGRLFELVAA